MMTWRNLSRVAALSVLSLLPEAWAVCKATPSDYMYCNFGGDYDRRAFGCACDGGCEPVPVEQSSCNADGIATPAEAEQCSAAGFRARAEIT
jgi:hypothetical protein